MTRIPFEYHHLVIKILAICDQISQLAFVHTFRYFEDEEKERILSLKNAPGNRVSGSSWFTSLSDHDRLLQTSNWFQGSYLEYTKGTGNFNKYRRGIRDGYLKESGIQRT